MYDCAVCGAIRCEHVLDDNDSKNEKIRELKDLCRRLITLNQYIDDSDNAHYDQEHKEWLENKVIKNDLYQKLLKGKEQ